MDISKEDSKKQKQEKDNLSFYLWKEAGTLFFTVTKKSMKIIKVALKWDQLG